MKGKKKKKKKEKRSYRKNNQGQNPNISFLVITK